MGEATMEQGSPKQTLFKQWNIRWLPSPEEIAFVRGKGSTQTARKAGFIFAAIAGIAATMAAGQSLGMAGDHRWLYLLPESALCLGLGWLLYQGRKWAPLALMAVISVDPLAIHLVLHGRGYIYVADSLAPWPLLLLLGSGLMMWVFYLCYVAERRQAEAAG